MSFSPSRLTLGNLGRLNQALTCLCRGTGRHRDGNTGGSIEDDQPIFSAGDTGLGLWLGNGGGCGHDYGLGRSGGDVAGWEPI